jgi:hypothetical protein
MKIENNRLIKVFKGDVKNGTLTIPDNITNIGYGAFAFENCSSLTSLIIPNNITSICNYAFADCSSLTSITIPNSVKSIGNGAFICCTRLKKILLPNDIKNINDKTFYGCHSLTSITIPNSVKSIGWMAFYNCDNLTDIIIPNGLKSIHNEAFRNCDKLKSIAIPNSVSHIGFSSAFRNCSSLKTITIEDTTAKPSKLTSIGDNTFQGCSSLNNITIPTGLTSIGAGAFSDCSELESEVNNYKAFKISKNKKYYCCPNLHKKYYSINKKTSENGVLKLLKKGLHYCTNLFEIFNYYYGEYDKDFVIGVGEVGDKVIEDDDCSLCCTNEFTLKHILTKKELINLLNGGSLKKENKNEVKIL